MEDSQQHTVTITTHGNADIQFFGDPKYNYQPQNFPETGPSGDEGQPGAQLPTASAGARKANRGRGQRPGEGRKKLRKMPQPQDNAQDPLDSAPPQDGQAAQQSPESPDLGPPAQSQPPPPKDDLAHKMPHIFHYSRCTGRKKAVCIGINYTGSKNKLDGCVNDAHNIRNLLMKSWKFKSEDIMVLTDDNRDSRRFPTKANMLNAMKWLVKDAKAHDSLFFHYSGHGGRLRDGHSDEVSGYDDIIFPVDHEQKGAGVINDDTMHDLMVKPLPDGCRLTAIFDSCHSGSALDLVYLYHSNGTLKNSPVSPQYRRLKYSNADVICFSGCEDTQTSADVKEGGLAVGAMSYAFIKCLNTANQKISYEQLLKNIRALLRQHFTQRPQLSSSHRIDIRRQFVL